MSSKIKKQKGLQPKLRFPEFRGTGDWEEKKLGSVVMAETSSLALGKQELLGSGYPIYGASGLAGFVSSYEQDQDYIAIVKDGSGVGNLFYCKKESSVLGTLNYLKSRDTDAYPLSWVYYLLQTINFSKYKKGSGIPHIYYSDYANELIATATPEELQKIAGCLSSLDELIAAEDAKLEALQKHKKGLMQELFPAEGETLPKRRFPEFKDAPEWEEKHLESLAKRGSGHTPSKSKPEYYNGGIKWISLADSKRLDQGLVSQTEVEITAEGIKNSSAVLHKAGSVLISRDAGIGRSAVMAIPMAVSQHFIVWTCDDQKLSNWFLYYLLQNSKPLFERAATGSTIKTIGLQFFIDLRFRIPSRREQQRIADFLSSVDDLIAAQNQKLDALRNHKKALMQQLFPTVSEEITT